MEPTVQGAWTHVHALDIIGAGRLGWWRWKEEKDRIYIYMCVLFICMMYDVFIYVLFLGEPRA